MKARTNLSSIKALAQHFLMMDIKTTPHSPVIVSHPFTDTGYVGFLGDRFPQTILENRDAFLRWQTEKKKQINESDSADRIFFMMTKPYRLIFLKYAEPHLSQKDFSRILGDVWIQVEAPHNDPNFTICELVNLFKKAVREFLMDQNEYEQFKELENSLTVYRGVTQYNAKNLNGLSWTLNSQTAEWFAHRFGEDGAVYKAQIDKSHIYAYFSRRNESEIIVDPKYLMDIAEYEEPTSELNKAYERKNTMTIYQKELLRQLPKLNCTGKFDEESGILHISQDGFPICRAAKQIELHWNQDKQVVNAHRVTLDTLSAAIQSIRKYVSLYESAPSLGISDLPEYRRLAEYDDVVLGAMYSEQHGFMFSTWRQDRDKKYVTHGDYSPEFEYAKESFISRSGLVNKNRLFTTEEAETLYRCIGYVREYCETLTYDQEQQIKALTEKLTRGYPQLENVSPSLRQDDAPQLNL